MQDLNRPNIEAATNNGDAGGIMKLMEAIGTLSSIIEESVQAAGPLGVPSGHVYAEVSTVGISLDIYESIIRGMVELGVIAKRGDVLYAA